VFDDVTYTRELLENDSGYDELVVREKPLPPRKGVIEP
jgi:hypothetical protein